MFRKKAALLAALSALALANTNSSIAETTVSKDSANDFGPKMVQANGRLIPEWRLRRREMRLLRRNERAESPDAARSKLGLTYVPGSTLAEQKLDLYLPLPSSPKPYPVVVFIHGGGWHSDNHPENKIFMPLVKRGFAVATIKYRLTPQAIFPAQIHDCKAAIRWLRANANEYGLDAKRIGVWGDSAGGHLAALLGTSNGVKELEGNLGNLKYSSDVQAVAEWFGPSDLVHMLEQLAKLPARPKINTPTSQQFVEWFLGGPVAQHMQAAKDASPITYVSKKTPPFFIAHGDNDRTVPIEQSREFNAALKHAGADVTFRVIPGAGHGTGAFPPDVRHQVLEFFDAKLHNSSNRSATASVPGKAAINISGQAAGNVSGKRPGTAR